MLFYIFLLFYPLSLSLQSEVIIIAVADSEIVNMSLFLRLLLVSSLCIIIEFDIELRLAVSLFRVSSYYHPSYHLYAY